MFSSNRPGKIVKNKEPIDKWLSERYALFQDSKLSINKFEIHHLEWPMNTIDVELKNISYSRYNTLITNKPDKIHYSNGVKVIAWGKEVL